MDEPNEKQPDVNEYADGFILERKGTDVPTFLKFAFIVIGGGCLTYFLIYMNGETTHDERGPLVRAFNSTTGDANWLMYCVAGLGLIYVVSLIVFVFRAFQED